MSEPKRAGEGEGGVETSGVALVDPGSEELEVFLTRRPSDSGFLPGFRGFFVGKAHSSDRRVPVGSTGPFREPSRRHFGCAIRELFEESGLLPLKEGWVATWEEDPVCGSPFGDWEEFRRHVDRGEIEFGDALAGASLAVDPHVLHPVGHWRTPEWAGLDTETEFFVAAVPRRLRSGVASHIEDAEHVDPQWVTPGEALSRWRDGEWFLSTPISLVLQGLERDGRVRDRPLFPPENQRDRAMREMIEILGGVRMLPLATPTLPPATHTNCYLIGEHAALIVDPGSNIGSEQRLLESALTRMSRQGCPPRAVVLTHHHSDHVGGVEAVCRNHELEVWAHGETADRLPGDLRVDRRLEDGEVLRVDPLSDHTLEVLHTPGHAPGHICLRHLRSGCVIAGDLVASKGTILIDPPEGEMGEYLESLRRVDELEPRALLPAHGTVVDAPHELLNYYLEHRREREQKVLEALRNADGPVQPQALVPEAYDDTPESAWPLAVRSLHAHLIHLVERELAVEGPPGFYEESSPESST